MKLSISHPSGPRTAALVLLAASLAWGCKEEAPEATGASEKTDPSPEKPDPAPKTDGDAKSGSKGDSKGGGKSGGLAAMTKGLIDDVTGPIADPLTLVPSSAVIVAQVQLVPFKLLPFWDEGRAGLMRELTSDDARLVDAFLACDMDIAQIQSATLAMVPGEYAMAVVSGPGYGLLKNHTCVRDRLHAAGHGTDYDIADHEGAKRIVLDRGETHGYFLSDDALLLVDKEIDAEVARLREGEGTSVRTGGDLKATIARVKTDDHAWVAARVVDFLRRDMGGAPIGTMHEFWGSARYEGELSVAFGARLDDASAATSARDMAQKQLDEMKTMLPMIGVSASTAAKIEFGAEDDRFTFAVSLTDTEMTSIQSALKGML